MAASSPIAIPQKAQVLVIGGGPGGSYAASALAREGLDVVLLEAERMPRYHVGESMLASMKHFLRFIDCEAKFVHAGFTKKNGAAFRLSYKKREGYTDFVSQDQNNFSWNVIRSQADEMLFRHAESCGAKVFDGVRVTDIDFASPESSSTSLASRLFGGWMKPKSETGADQNSSAALGRPVSARWRTSTGDTGSIAFNYVVDASGRAGLLSTKYYRSRKVNESLKNMAIWGYWEGAGVYKGGPTNNGELCEVGVAREGSPYFEALSDESGWCWFIPLPQGITSVGIVMDEEIANRKKKEFAAQSKDSANANLSTTHQLYLAQLALANNITKIIGENAKMKIAPPVSSDSALNTEVDADSTLDAELRGFLGISHGGTTIKSASNYSYAASSYAGEGYRIIGDAGAHIDPYFSSGVHLAFAGGLSAAATICAALKSQCSEREAADWHSARVGTAYTRFLMVVLSAYRQIRSQSFPVLADVDEDNFDRAFEHFRPVIQGTSDTTARNKLSETELQRTIEFCARGFEPTDPNERARVLNEAEVRKDGLLVTNEIGVDAREFNADTSHGPESEVKEGDEDWLRVVHALNARKFLRTEDIQNIDNFVSDSTNGMKLDLRVGGLGLVKA